jgi:hypothetical protein
VILEGEATQRGSPQDPVRVPWSKVDRQLGAEGRGDGEAQGVLTKRSESRGEQKGERRES